MHHGNGTTAAGFLAGVYAFLAGMTMGEFASLVGIAGVTVSVFFQWRRDRREQRAIKYQLGIREDRRAAP